jgi:sugar/nucleoside kinase (ribokinase family)
MGSSVELDYLVIGYATRDLIGAGEFRIGGTVSYAARTARALGCRVGAVTSANPDLDLSKVLDGVLIARHPAAHTTTFENIYVGLDRIQVLHSTAESLTPAMIPADWQARIVHLGPVAQECPAALLDRWEGAFVGVTPQGWMRCWDEDGRVSLCAWRDSAAILARADAVVLSETDLVDQAIIAEYVAQARLLVVTRGAKGCTVYSEGAERSFPAPRVRELDPTGAGDIFAAAFFLWMDWYQDPWAAARFANCIAASSVTRVGVSGTPTPGDCVRCRRALLDAG